MHWGERPLLPCDICSRAVFSAGCRARYRRVLGDQRSGASSGRWFLVDFLLKLQVPYLVCEPPSSVELRNAAPSLLCVFKHVGLGPPGVKDRTSLIVTLFS